MKRKAKKTTKKTRFLQKELDKLSCRNYAQTHLSELNILKILTLSEKSTFRPQPLSALPLETFVLRRCNQLDMRAMRVAFHRPEMSESGSKWTTRIALMSCGLHHHFSRNSPVHCFSRRLGLRTLQTHGP